METPPTRRTGPRRGGSHSPRTDARACGSPPARAITRSRVSSRVVRRRLREHGLAALVEGFDVERALARSHGTEGDLVPGHDDAREADRNPAKVGGTAGGLGRDRG